jgi:uncharacterized protein (DUF433 family)
MATEQAIAKTIIKKTPGVCSGDACIGNRRIMVWLLVAYRKAGMDDQSIMRSFDGPLTQADLDAAWEYYAHNQEEIDAAIRSNESDSDEDE